MSKIALIPLRAGSKGIVNKNIKMFKGKPLAFWTIQAAIDSGIFDNIYVSSDGSHILELVTDNYPQVKTIKREAHLATDEASTDAVMLDFASRVGFDLLCTLQATSPFTEGRHIREAFQKFSIENYDSMLTAVEFKRFLWSENNEPLNYDPRVRPRRQEMKKAFMENGAFYFTKRETLLETKNRLGGKIGIYVMEDKHYLELDSQKDWEILESL